MRLAAAVGVSLVAGVAAAAWTALTLAEFGHFVAAVPILAFPAAAVATFRLLARGRTLGPPPAVAPEDLLAVGLACATLLLTLPADEILLGGQDPGVYVHIAASVARGGSLLIEAPDLAALSAEEQDLLTRYFVVPEPFLGMRILPDGRVYPQFYHLFPGLMAVAWSIGGLRAALLVNPLLNVAAILALYALATLLLGRRWALAAALVHAVSAAQIRQAKLPTAEMAAQFFLLAGVALLALATRDEDPPPGVALLAGASLGMAALTRSDTIIFLIPLFAVLLAGMGPAGRTRPVLAALGTTGVFFAQSWVHRRFISPDYEPLSGLVGAALLAAAISVGALLLARRTGVSRRAAGGLLRHETLLRSAAAGIVAGWVLFGWLLRPRLAGSGRVGQLFRHLAGDPPWSGAAALLAGAESRNMLYLVDLLGAAGLVAATAGIAALIVSRRRLWETAWLGASAALLVAVTVNVYHDHTLMWVSRRFIPVVLPLTSVGIAAAAAACARRGRSAGALAGIALVAAVIGLNAGATRAMAAGREWPGLIGWYEHLERAVPAGADLYCDQPGFAAPLRFLSGRRSYELQDPRPERIARLIALMRRKAAEGREVVYLSERQVGDPWASGLVPLARFPLGSSILVQSKRGVPTGTKPRGADFVLYRVQPP